MENIRKIKTRSSFAAVFTIIFAIAINSFMGYGHLAEFIAWVAHRNPKIAEAMGAGDTVPLMIYVVLLLLSVGVLDFAAITLVYCLLKSIIGLPTYTNQILISGYEFLPDSQYSVAKVKSDPMQREERIRVRLVFPLSQVHLNSRSLKGNQLHHVVSAVLPFSNGQMMDIYIAQSGARKIKYEEHRMCGRHQPLHYVAFWIDIRRPYFGLDPINECYALASKWDLDILYASLASKDTMDLSFVERRAPDGTPFYEVLSDTQVDLAEFCSTCCVVTRSEVAKLRQSLEPNHFTKLVAKN